MRIATLLSAGLLACSVALAAHAKTFKYADQGDSLPMDPMMLNESLLLDFTGNMCASLTGRGKKLELRPELARLEPDCAHGVALHRASARAASSA